MKKLMLIISVAFTATLLNASSFSWRTADAIYAYNGVDYYTGTVNLYAYTTTGTKADSFFVTSYDMSSVSNGKVPFTEFDNTPATSETAANLIAGSRYNFYYILENTVGGIKYTYTSAEVLDKIAPDGTGTTQITFKDNSLGTQTQSNWKAEAVPEPTSGLLLLLGVAGLALKRKRA